ncbi:MAG TPA: DUF3787 domain-containing protein [Clostridiaceae bacterium]|nr:DUF3787 domain-containing protein [Clostridiaceae bacterium]
MKGPDKRKVKSDGLELNKIKAYATNAITDVSDTVTEGNIPIASDECVEEARDWVNNGSRL